MLGKQKVVRKLEMYCAVYKHFCKALSSRANEIAQRGRHLPQSLTTYAQSPEPKY